MPPYLNNLLKFAGVSDFPVFSNADKDNPVKEFLNYIVQDFYIKFRIPLVNIFCKFFPPLRHIFKKCPVNRDAKPLAFNIPWQQSFKRAFFYLIFGEQPELVYA